jgi:phage protein D
MTTSDRAEPIYRENDFYVPYFKVLIGSRELDRTVTNDIISLTYTDNLTNIDSFDMTINNWDADKRTFKYIEGEARETFYPGQDVEIRMGYYYQGREKLSRMLFGEITTLEPNFPGSGSPVLSVRGLNLLHRLRDRQRSDSYVNKRDSEIARTIAGRIGIDFSPIPAYRTVEESNAFLFQDNQYDIVFLMDRARAIGYELYIEYGENNESKLVFKPSTQGKKTYLLEWGRSMLNFRPTLTTANQVSEVVVTGWNPDTKARVVGRARRDDMETRALGLDQDIQVIERSMAQRVEVVADRPVTTTAEAEQEARETLEKISKGMVKGSGTTVGLPDLRAGTYIEIKNLGEIFSGNYYVTQTTHSINDSGYTTTFNARKEERT